MLIKDGKFLSIQGIPDESPAIRCLNSDMFFAKRVLQRFGGRLSSVNNEPQINFQYLCRRARQKYSNLFPSFADTLISKFLQEISFAAKVGYKRSCAYRRRVKPAKILRVDQHVIGETAASKILRCYKRKHKEFPNSEVASYLTKRTLCSSK